MKLSQGNCNYTIYFYLLGVNKFIMFQVSTNSWEKYLLLWGKQQVVYMGVLDIFGDEKPPAVSVNVADVMSDLKQ